MKSYDSINSQPIFLLLIPNKNNGFAFPPHDLSGKLILAIIITFCSILTVYSQYTSTYYATPTTPNGFAGSRVFRQERLHALK